jgi:hypothetical protein
MVTQLKPSTRKKNKLLRILSNFNFRQRRTIKWIHEINTEPAILGEFYTLHPQLLEDG